MAGVCRQLVQLIKAGWQLVITHGNGPVVGNILFRMARTASELPPMPMDVCVAHSQGGMGYMLQQSLGNVMREAGLPASVCAMVTQVEVDAADPAFQHPTKPVGRFFSADEAQQMAQQTGWTFAEDSGRGWRRVVPSPAPLRILEIDAVRALMQAGILPVVSGGGGIPVVRAADGSYHGAPAVIDKDLTSAMLATELGAQKLLLLTGVDQVALDFGRPTQRLLDRLTVSEAREHYLAGQFPPGSMGPKVQAAMQFLQSAQCGAAAGSGGSSAGREVVITSLDRAVEAMDGKAGTRMVAS
jgi:carbamate kinase